MKCILCRGNDFKLIYEKDSKNKGELFVSSNYLTRVFKKRGH